MKIFLLLIITNILIYANLIKQQDLYEKGEYKASLQEARDSVNDRSSYKHHLFWGKSAEALGEMDEAMSAYERVLFLDEENVEAMVALVNIYRYTDREELEFEMSEQLRGHPLSESQKKSLRISKNRPIHSLKISGSLSYGQDSNINSSPGTVVMDDYIGTTGNTGELSTMFARFIGRISYHNELGTKGGWYSKEELRVYYQNNIDASLYNIFVGTLEAGIGHSGGKYSFFIPLSYDYVHYLEKTLFNQYKINPRVTFPVLNNLIASLNFSFSSRSYVEEADKARDDTTIGVGFALYYLLDDNFIYFNSKYEMMSADNSNPASFIDKVLLSTSVGIKYNLVSKLVLKADYKLKYGNYDDTIGTTLVPDNSTRADTSNQFDLKLSYLYNKKSTLFISNRYTQNSSNYAPAEYNKKVVMLGLSLNF